MYKSKDINYVDNPEQTIISIATGIQGLEHGLTDIGVNIKVAAFVEVEAFIIANLGAAMEKGEMDPVPIWADVKTFPSKHFHGKVHGVTAGYPCQPFSNAGSRKGIEDSRHIFPDILRLIKSVEPIWCFFENVEGHLSMGYEDVYRSLRSMGYKVEAGLFSAEEVGAPHGRKRLFILAVKLEYANGSQIKRIIFGNDSALPGIGSSSNLAELANSDSIGIPKSLSKPRANQFEQNGHSWPAKRGQPQHYFEEPRTVEPCMGSAIDGYNFRTDILRALGNGVVKQTASKAFITILNRF